MVRMRILMTGFVAALCLCGAQPSLAGEQYSDAKLQSFADAVLAVNAVVEQWRPQIQGAPNETGAEQMAQEANEEMRAAVAGTEGITVDEYQQIAQAAQTDAQLMARIDQVLQGMAPAAQ